MWCGGAIERTLDWESSAHRFNPGHFAVSQRRYASRSHTCLCSPTEEIGTGHGCWHSKAGKVTAGLAESDGSLLLALW